ncbi:MAG: roadblock/LC7 domain-containing protein [Desulfuromonadales bacterium]|nr:roadblock/LC7 domain-containing protein [Desulfuromonadales bacterium]NIR32988.1 roadblock/LC7 domain-containing protein [Desulfuromonadales bacterium]NIS40326.1 roadblock/LC7 domain-containing protein [Desulfuromonadales bacterium]
MFSDILQGIVEQSGGGIGISLMGYDGIAIEQHLSDYDEVDLQLLAVEYANVLKEVKRAVEVLNTGFMEEVTVKTGRFLVVVRALNDEYFVVLTLTRDGNIGKARYLLMREAPKLREALA